MKDDGRDGLPRSEEPDEGGGGIDGGCIAVPNGKYELRYMYYETAMYFGSPRVVVHCAIDATDQYAGIEVCRFYNVKEVTQPTGKYGDYVALPCGDLVREYKKLVSDPKRMNRISFSVLKGKRLLGRLARVTRSHSRDSLIPEHQYSKIKEFITVIPDDQWP